MSDTAHIPVRLANGKVVCSGCERPVHTVAQGPSRPKRSKVVIYEPVGEEGELEDLLTQLVERYQTIWPDILSEVGVRHWRYKALHFALYSLLTASPDVAARLLPSEKGA